MHEKAPSITTTLPPVEVTTSTTEPYVTSAPTGESTTTSPYLDDLVSETTATTPQWGEDTVTEVPTEPDPTADEINWDEQFGPTPYPTEAALAPERKIEPKKVSKIGAFLLKLKGITISHHASGSRRTAESEEDAPVDATKLKGTLLNSTSKLKGTLLEQALSGNNSGVALQEALATEDVQPGPDAMTTEIAIEKDDSAVDVVEYGTVLDSATVVERLGQNGVVKRAPTLEEIATDPDRTNGIVHLESPYNLTTHDDSPERATFEAEEGEAVAGLMEFLSEVVDKVPASATRARDMLENVTYIGEKERHEAVTGIAEYWKGWLRDNPDRQLCALASISSRGGENKSDRFLLDGILGKFSDEELVELGDRLVTEISALSSKPEDTKIIMLDDWTISGSQMEGAFQAIAKDAEQYIGSLEMQLVTSTEERIREGKTVSYMGEQHIIPIRSYFLSHRAELETQYAYKGHRAYETGSHSAVDFDFQDDIYGMKSALEQRTGQVRNMPPTTNIRRQYKRAKLVNTERLAARRRADESELAGV